MEALYNIDGQGRGREKSGLLTCERTYRGALASHGMYKYALRPYPTYVQLDIEGI